MMIYEELFIVKSDAPEEEVDQFIEQMKTDISTAGGNKAVATNKKQYFRRKKVCRFCTERVDDINYKDIRMLSSFVAERGKIVPRRISGVCAPHQRRLSDAIKKARNIALLPFAASI